MRLLYYKKIACLVLIGALPLLPCIAQTTCVWTGLAADSDWFNPGNWDNGTPGVGDTAVINAGADVILNAPSAELASFEMSGGTLTFTNWTTCLTADDVIINAGTVTLPAAFTNNAMSNRVWFVCENFTLETSAEINVDAKGYAGAEGDGNGPGATLDDDHTPAAGYGGRGADGGRYAFNPGGQVYGSVDGPALPGSGSAGGSGGRIGGSGGGAVQIDATGHVTINGVISARGGAGTTYSGAGSGGGVHITCHTFAGSGGMILADGQDGSDPASAGSGGGRIAIIYNPEEQAALPVPDVCFSARGGRTANPSLWVTQHSIEDFFAEENGQPGTLYFPDNRFLTSPLRHNGVWMAPAFNELNFNNLVASNVQFYIPATNLTLTVENDMEVSNNARLMLTNATLNIGGSMTVSNALLDLQAGSPHGGTEWITRLEIGGDLTVRGTDTTPGRLRVTAGETNALNPLYGALVSVAGNTLIEPYGWIEPFSHPFNGGSVFFQLNNLTVETNAGFNAHAAGFRGGYSAADGYGHGYGLGDPTRCTGAGYGGRGGRSETQTYRGATYASPEMPIHPGSGGGGGRTLNVGLGGRGGGLIHVQANKFILHGTLAAKGSSANVGTVNYSGGGSGGGILVKCGTFTGTPTSLLNADGGDYGQTYCGGGGGGRIAIYYGDQWTENTPPHHLVVSEIPPASFEGATSVLPGASYVHTDSSEPGTVRFIQVLYPKGSFFSAF